MGSLREGSPGEGPGRVRAEERAAERGAEREAGPALLDGVRACLLDLDGVITGTAVVHARAWKHMCDDFLRSWSQRQGEPFVPFDLDRDYARYVDGRPRLDGTRTFLSSRGITLPEGAPDDPPGAATVQGLSNAKNAEVVRRISTEGVKVYPDAVDFLHAVRRRGLATAVVSSSANTVDVLRATGLTDLFDARIDGLVAARRGLPGKPAPDTFLAGAADLGVPPEAAAVFEDALAGVAAGHAGGFAVVVGVDRVGHGHADDLRTHGADVVVTALTQLLEPEEER